MDKLIPIFIVLGIIILGFIMKLIEVRDIIKRINFTNDYHSKFIKLINEIQSQKKFNQNLYYELTSDVKAMQEELGSDGVYAHVTDNLNGFSATNYQMLINFLPELRNVLNDYSNSVMMIRYDQSAKDCDDMFIRHIGTLNRLEKSYKKNLFNPFSCFSSGMRFIVSLPILILHWFGFISPESTRKAKRNWFIKFLSFIVTLAGFISAIISIFIGWNDFIQIVTDIF